MLKAKEMDSNLDMSEKENFKVETVNENFEKTLETFAIFVPTDVENLTKAPDDYDYDMETSHNIFFWDELLPTLAVYCLTFALGLVGNVLIIFTIFRYRKMKSTTNVFLASLASSDLLLILFCIPVKSFVAYFLRFLTYFVIGITLRKICRLKHVTFKANVRVSVCDVNSTAMQLHVTSMQPEVITYEIHTKNGVDVVDQKVRIHKCKK